MDELETERLEERLRKMAVGRKAAAPQALKKFIDMVPAMAPAGRRFALPMGRTRVRRGVMGLAAAAALIVALAGSAALISYRSNRASNAGADGWSWQRADGTIVSRPAPVAHGFVGTCMSSLTDTGALCSSADGIKWTTPADPAIVSVPGGGEFQFDRVVRSGDVYVASAFLSAEASATPTPCLSPDGCWSPQSESVLLRSVDGVRWSRVDSAAFSGLTLTQPGTTTQLGTIRSGFIVAAASTPDEIGWALTSPDGLTWTRSSRLPVQPGSAASEDSVGFVAVSDQAWRTLDGVSWTRLSLPAGIGSVANVAPVPSGFIGTTVSGPGGGGSLARSEDGLTWRVDPVLASGTVFSLLLVGDQLVASTTPEPPTSATQLSSIKVWQSADWGVTWQPVLGPDGQQISGLASRMGDKLAVNVPDADRSPRLTWVGTLSESATRTAAPTAAPTVSALPASPQATATPAAVASASASSAPLTTPTSSYGWSWQPADGTDVVMVGKVARGYLGTCIGEHTMVMCSSPDGRKWSMPADPAIVSVTGGGSIWGAPVSSGGVYLAPDAGFDTPREGLGVARSTDGVHWTRLDSNALLGLRADSVWSIPSGFMVLGTNTAERRTWAMTSKDGLTWTRGAEVPISAEIVSSGAAGLYVSDYTSNWRTLDGTKWERVQAPAGIAVETTYAVPGGGFVAAGLKLTNPPNFLLRSDDGITWRTDQGDLPGTFGGLYVVGDRMLATSSDVTATHEWTAASLWESTDWGRTWHKVTDLVSHGLAESMLQLGDSLDLRDMNGNLVWVGSLGAEPTASPGDGSAAPAT